MIKKSDIGEIVLIFLCILFVFFVVGGSVFVCKNHPQEPNIFKPDSVEAEAMPIALTQEEKAFADKIVIACINGVASRNNDMFLNSRYIKDYYRLAYEITKTRRRLK